MYHVEKRKVRAYAINGKMTAPASHKRLQELFDALQVALYVSLHSSVASLEASSSELEGSSSDSEDAISSLGSRTDVRIVSPKSNTGDKDEGWW